MTPYWLYKVQYRQHFYATCCLTMLHCKMGLFIVYPVSHLLSATEKLVVWPGNTHNKQSQPATSCTKRLPILLGLDWWIQHGKNVNVQTAKWFSVLMSHSPHIKQITHQAGLFIYGSRLSLSCFHASQTYFFLKSCITYNPFTTLFGKN